MTRVFNLNDKLIFITRNDLLIDANNKVLAKIRDNSIVTGDDDKLLAVYGENHVNDLKGAPLLRISTDKVYFRGRELCTLEGGSFKERALGAAGFLFFG